MEELSRSIDRARAGDTEDLREDPIEYALHWHRRIAGPFAPALFGLVGVPIAMRRTRGARSMGMLWCAGLAFSYYLLLSLSEFLAIQGWFSAVTATWIPNACFAVLGVVLLLRARRAGM